MKKGMIGVLLVLLLNINIISGLGTNTNHRVSLFYDPSEGDNNSNNNKYNNKDNDNNVAAVRIRSHANEGPVQLQKNALLRGSTGTPRGGNDNNNNNNNNGQERGGFDARASSTFVGTNNIDDDQIHSNHSKDASQILNDREDEADEAIEADEGENNDNDDDNDSMTAIVHIGPHKTGTTSIQAYTAILHKELVMDGYEMPWGLVAHNLKFVNKEPYINLNQFNLVSCLQDCKELWPEAKCNPALIDATETIAKSRKNILLTAEEFARTDLVHIDRLKSLLKPWKNTRIVAYYRRFCDWLYSYWHQFAKYQSVEYRHSFPQFISDVEAMEHLHDHTYTVGAVSHYRVYFNDVVVFNMHDMGQYRDVSEVFFCETISDGTSIGNFDGKTTSNKTSSRGAMSNTCSAVKYRDNHGQFIEFNHVHPLVYEELAWHAQQANLIFPNETFTIQNITEKTRHHQEVVLNKTQYEFGQYVLCPNTELLEWLLQTTLDDEYEFFPSFFDSPAGEDVIRNKFEKDRTTKFCSIDAKRIIEHDEPWRQFFSNLMR